MANRPPRGKSPSRRRHHDPQGRLYAATHEAGHAIVGTLLGFDLRSVDLRRRDRDGGFSAGATKLGFFRDEMIIGMGRDSVFSLLVVLSAGVAAESLVNPGAEVDSGRTDLEAARRYAVMAICDHEVKRGSAIVAEEEVRSMEDQIAALILEASREAARLVAENVGAVNSVAEQLMRRGRMTGDDVAAIVNTGRGAPPE